MNREARRAAGERRPLLGRDVPMSNHAAAAADSTAGSPAREIAIETVGEDEPSIHEWRERIRLSRAGHHGVNAYKCPVCGKVTMTIDVDPGVTPMMLGCRRTPGCTGWAQSAMYPDAEPPAALLEHLEWEWALPAPTDRLDVRIVEHVRRGGLVLRPRTDRPSAYTHGPDDRILTLADRPVA